MKAVLSWRRHYYVKGASIFLIAIALIAGMVGCGAFGGNGGGGGGGGGNGGGDEGGESYILTISCTNGGSIITPGEGTFTYNSVTVVPLTTIAEEGYQFVNWTGNVSTVANVNAPTTTITMTGNYSITANFAAVACTLTISSTAGGSVTVPGEAGPYTYDEGEEVNLVAKADGGYDFVNWTGDVDTIGNVEASTTTIIMHGAYSITANFEAYFMVAAGYYHTVGLKCDGTVVAVGRDYEGQCEVDGWTDIVQVAAGAYHTVGLKNNGTVVAVGDNSYGQRDVDSWTNIIQVAAGALHTVGVKEDGSVVAVGLNDDGQCGVSGWKDIVQVAAGGWHTVGVKDNGTVVAVGWKDDGQCDVSDWKDIVQVAAGAWHTVGVKNNGHVVAVGRDYEGQCDVSGWTDIVQVTAGWKHTVGLKSDGTVVATGDNNYGQCNVSGWMLKGPWSLTISSTYGGTVTVPGEGMSTCNEGEVVDLVAEPSEHYQFVKWTGDVDTIADVHDASTTITMNDNYAITANFNTPEIWDWYDLDAIRDNLGGSYLLMDDLDSTTAGYTELASPTANEGKGWQPMGYWYWDGEQWVEEEFEGTFDGQGYEIRDLSINRPDEDYVGLFGVVGEGGIINNVGVVNADVTGYLGVGGLAGVNFGIITNSYATGSVTGYMFIGGLVAGNIGNVSDSYSTASVSGDGYVGGLVGENDGSLSNSYSTGDVIGSAESLRVGGLVGWNCGDTVSNSYATGSVSGYWYVGGLVGHNEYSTVSDAYSTGSVSGYGYVGGLVGYSYGGTVSDAYSIGSVTGEWLVGGLVGFNYAGIVNNSYYNYDEVLINGENIITIGALPDGDFDQWLAQGKFLDVNERLSQEDGYYVVSDVSDFKELLAFGQDSSLKFRLKNDLDLASEPDFYIPYLAGEFDGNGHKISNLSLNFDFVSIVGLFGYLASGGRVTELGVENVNITGFFVVGGLVGFSGGTVDSSYSTGSVTGNYSGGLVGSNSYYATVSNSYSTGSVTGGNSVGGLVGSNDGTVSDSYSTGSVTGNLDVGGLVGYNTDTVSNSFWDTETSGQASSAGGTGKTTAQMKDIATFSGATWDIVAVASADDRDTGYIWNIVDDGTYPFLSWQPV